MSFSKVSDLFDDEPKRTDIDLAGFTIDEVEVFEERAAIREYVGGESREEAERAAFEALAEVKS